MNQPSQRRYLVTPIAVAARAHGRPDAVALIRDYWARLEQAALVEQMAEIAYGKGMPRRKA